MPNTREKLIELLSQVQYLGGLEEKIADHLIANGVTIPVRCKECTFCNYNSSSETYKCTSMKGMYRTVKPDEFCSYGERKVGE